MRKFIALLMAALLVSCAGGGRSIERIEPETQTDLSGRWNDTDARLVAEEMISDCLSRPWLTEFAAEQGRKPVVTVGRIRNRTTEHIDMEVFTKDFERELINSGQVKFVGTMEERQDVREERADQSEYASPETIKQMRQETGADFVLLGAVKSVEDRQGGDQVVFYQTDLELINVESNEKAWIGTKEIKKFISQPRYRR